MGRVRAAAQEAGARTELYILEIICRTLKLYLRARQRELMKRLQMFAEDLFKKEVIDVLNCVTCPSKHEHFWRVEIKKLIINKFGSEALTEEEKRSDYNLKDSLSRLVRGFVIQRLMQMLGLQYDEDLLNEAKRALMDGREFEFTLLDFPEGALKPKVCLPTTLSFLNGLELILLVARSNTCLLSI